MFWLRMSAAAVFFTALLPYCPTALLPYCPTALLPYCPTALLPYSFNGTTPQSPACDPKTSR
ncbi:hypothetical protein H717_03209 [Brucella ovis IntaBari-2001-319-4082]|nr:MULTISPECIES: hypothetical protein [Brucella]ENQ99623.1 hypothetical protein C010_03225 [Brucella ovis 80/125]ENT60668.1 hypothetical protein B968_02910 [Brucella suis F8/06-3]ENT97868.1 hypothetical protein H717_03209 [Brucella ovis IntaBari-2001-319-4082]ENU03707.1 hypothetical protein H719_03219 [Brucella ovis IntaBari-1993-758]SUW68597.1 Uncharacterised protein [Brucella ovis]